MDTALVRVSRHPRLSKLTPAKGTLHTSVTIIQGDIQYPRLLFGTLSIHSQCPRFKRTRQEYAGNILNRGGHTFTKDSKSWSRMEAERGTQSRHGM